MAIDPVLLGQILLKKGFKTWFLYMFRVIEKRPFIMEKIHEPLFDFYQDIHDLKTIRGTINLPPRSAKTQLAKYFVVYSYTINPKCNFIYTSYSQELLGDIAREIANVFLNPIYQAMYPEQTVEQAAVHEDAVDAFWKEYLLENYKQAKYTSRKIITAQGGVILFSAMGATITGFGASIRGAEGFTGCIVIDDAQKPSEAESERMQKKVTRFFSETLLSRCNNANTPILNIQQRLNVKDLSGFLESVYSFRVLRLPLVDANGVCQIPSQYPEWRLKEIMTDSYMFNSQYQQQPVVRGGTLIKIEDFNRYRALPPRFERVYVVADTALENKDKNDFSVFALCGVQEGQLYIIDMIFGRWIFTELVKNIVNKYREWSDRYKMYNRIEAVYIERKASGIPLIQTLRTQYHLPISDLVPSRDAHSGISVDKYTRYMQVSALVKSKYVWIPENTPSWLDEFLLECSGFDGGDQATHDDMVDVLIYALLTMQDQRRGTEKEWQEALSIFD